MNPVRAAAQPRALEPATVLCDHVAAARGSFGTLGRSEASMADIPTEKNGAAPNEGELAGVLSESAVSLETLERQKLETEIRKSRTGRDSTSVTTWPSRHIGAIGAAVLIARDNGGVGLARVRARTAWHRHLPPLGERVYFIEGGSPLVMPRR